MQAARTEKGGLESPSQRVRRDNITVIRANLSVLSYRLPIPHLFTGFWKNLRVG